MKIIIFIASVIITYVVGYNTGIKTGIQTGETKVKSDYESNYSVVLTPHSKALVHNSILKIINYP